MNFPTASMVAGSPRPGATWPEGRAQVSSASAPCATSTARQRPCASSAWPSAPASAPTACSALASRRCCRSLGGALSNAEIGQRLFISPKTVEHHVGKILSKLGLKNRSAVAAYLVRRAGSGSKPRPAAR
jgi:DNA-binding CsgD family transcriptional regulator